MSIPFVPAKFQVRGVKFLLQTPGGGLLLDPGMRKTSTTLAAYRVLRKQKMVRRMLVIAPLRVAYGVWPEEVAKWTEFNEFSINVLHGKHKEDLLAEQADIDIVNPEGLPWLMDRKFGAWPWQMLVVDESSKLKSWRGVRYQYLKERLDRFQRRVILTGSPASNHLMDLFAQMYIADMGHSFGPYITAFRDNYFYKVDEHLYVPLPDTEDRIFNDIKDKVLRMSAEDYLDLPELIINDVRVELPPAARLVYDQMENLLFAMIDNATTLAVNSGVAAGKCRQIANGGVYVDDGEARWKHVHDAKLDATEELLDELNGKPAIVVYEFKHELERLLKRFGKDTPFFGGGVSMNKGVQLAKDWNAGKVPLLLIHPKSAAHGLNLQEAGEAIIWHSNTFSLEEFEQLNRRLYRSGRKSRVVVHRILAVDTVDEAIVAAQARKKKTQDTLLDALKEYSARRKLQASTRGLKKRSRG